MKIKEGPVLGSAVRETRTRDLSITSPTPIGYRVWLYCRSMKKNETEIQKQKIYVFLAVGRALLRSENRRKLLPEVVAAAYAHALFARRPRPVYLVGADALLAAVIGCLPRWLQDRLLPVFFHYPRPPPRRDLPEVETHG